MASVSEQRRKRLWLFFASAVVIVVVLAIAIGFSRSSSGPSAQKLAKDAQTTNSLLAGIPQEGLALGSPSAPVTLTEFADLQCPFCRDFSRHVWPQLVQRYVRTGRLRIVFRNLDFIGADSVIAARAAGAAALQNRLWQFVDIFYANQGDENSGYVRGKFLRGVAAAASLDVARVGRDAASPQVAQLLAQAKSEASRFGIKSTPSFVLAASGRQPVRIKASSFGDFQKKIDAALRG
jgi:protein-disulfide isomerase